jgi:assimilatory nitrate reductase catalytic subunit
VTQDGLVRIENEQGALVMRAAVTESQRAGEVFAAMHWTERFTSAGAIAQLVHDRTDTVSGQPDLKGSMVRLSAVTARWAGLLLRRKAGRPDISDAVYWSKAPVESGFAFDLAGWIELASVIDSEKALRRLLHIPPEAELVSYSDPKKSIFRYAGLIGNRLEACLFLASTRAQLPSRDSVLELFGRGTGTAERAFLLAANLDGDRRASDRTVCVCGSVGANRLAATIRKHGLKTVAEIGDALQAGTHCGSCIPELKKLLDRHSTLEPVS